MSGLAGANAHEIRKRGIIPLFCEMDGGVISMTAHRARRLGEAHNLAGPNLLASDASGRLGQPGQVLGEVCHVLGEPGKGQIPDQRSAIGGVHVGDDVAHPDMRSGADVDVNDGLLLPPSVPWLSHAVDDPHSRRPEPGIAPSEGRLALDFITHSNLSFGSQPGADAESPAGGKPAGDGASFRGAAQ